MAETAPIHPRIHIALWEPEIPPNTGNIARLCAATGSPLHLIGRLGFRLDERSLRRAGLDYWSAVVIHQHLDMTAFEKSREKQGRIVCFSAHATEPYTSFSYQEGDSLLFGPETRGLPDEILARHRQVVIPMLAGKVRSLNLATAAGIALYEALRQLHCW